MLVIIIICSVLALLLFFYLWKGKLGAFFERLSIFWFRLALAFLLLFILNLVGSFVGLNIPINFFSAIIIALLGVPGVFSIGLISFLI